MSIIVLNATTKSIEALLEGAVAANQPEFSAHYADVTATAFTEGENDGVLNNTTAVSLVAGPAASTRRIVKEIVIYNADTAAVTVTIRINNNSNYRRIQKVTLAAGATWKLSDGGVSNSSGTGDVVGPASATDGHLAVFDGPTGKLLKDGGAVPAGGGGGEPFEGYLVNGKISVTVASGNITVAIKTLADTDPSAGDPVQIRIGNVIREITSALSVTKNAGTNWFVSGGAPFATKEIDYFVYVGYNVTDGVVLGFARIPDAGLYSDFSATSTNEKYCAISMITNAAAGDYYVNIGRFAATLSATAAFSWSVPTFTNNNLIQHPIYESRWLTWVPTPVGFSTPPTLVAKYQIGLHKCMAKVATSVAGTSNATNFTLSAPLAALSDVFFPLALAQNNGTTTYQAMVGVSGGTITVYNAGSSSGWTNSGLKYADFTIPYER